MNSNSSKSTSTVPTNIDTLASLFEYPSVILFASHFSPAEDNAVESGELAWIAVKTIDGSMICQCALTVTREESSSSNESTRATQEEEHVCSNSMSVDSIQKALQKFDQFVYEKFIKTKCKFCLVLYDAQKELHADRKGLYQIADKLGIRLAAHYQNYCDLKTVSVPTYPSTSGSVSSILEGNKDEGLSNTDKIAQIQAQVLQTIQSELQSFEEGCIAKCIKMQQFFIQCHEKITALLHEKIRNFKLSAQAPVWTGKIVSTIKPITSPVVRLRGLPWTCNEQDIVNFFENCKFASKSASVNHSNDIEEESYKASSFKDENEKINIEAQGSGDENILLVLNHHGRATGEAYVEFISVAEAKKAFKKDRTYMKHRYIEIFASSKRDMENCRRFMEYELGILGNSTVIRMRGLPYKASIADVEKFFDGLEIAVVPKRSKNPDEPVTNQKNILIVISSDGKSTGDAYVEFKTADIAKEAMKRNKEKIFNRYIELFRSSIAEMNAARKFTKYYAQYNTMHQAQILNSYPMNYVPYNTFTESFEAMPVYVPEQSENRNFSDYVVKLTGLPADKDEKYVADLFSDLGIEIADRGIHLVFDENEVFTGEAFVELFSEENVENAISNLNNLKEKNGIQVSKCDAQEMLRACGVDPAAQDNQQLQMQTALQFQEYIDQEKYFQQQQYYNSRYNYQYYRPQYQNYYDYQQYYHRQYLPHQQYHQPYAARQVNDQQPDDYQPNEQHSQVQMPMNESHPRQNLETENTTHYNNNNNDNYYYSKTRRGGYGGKYNHHYRRSKNYIQYQSPHSEPLEMLMQQSYSTYYPDNFYHYAHQHQFLPHIHYGSRSIQKGHS
jgi:RNA recognition motif-containing protein